MAGVLKNYDFKQVSVILATSIVTGFVEGDDAVTVTQDTDAFSKTVGADGEVTRSKSNNSAGSVTLRLMQTSDTNDVLSAFAAADRLSNSGRFPIIIKDQNGRTLHSIEQAWVKKLPDSQLGANAQAREWVLDCASIDSFIGGN